jgi:nicotinamide-nucleotide amidase
MEKLVCEEVLPRLQEIFHHEHAVLYKVLQCTGISESNLSDQLTDFEAQLPENIKLAYLPKPGIIRLRLTASGANNEELQTSLIQQFEKLKVEVGSLAFADEDIPMEAVIGKLLRGSGRRVATAESCTGGFIAHLITSVPGSSEYFQGSVVSYSNQVKRDILNVREDNLKKRGAVSEPVVSDMALNVMDLLDVDYAVATSGIAGPDGGTTEKPVGTVWMAVATPTRLTTKEFHFGKHTGRKQIIERAAHAALNMLRIEIEKDLRR